MGVALPDNVRIVSQLADTHVGYSIEDARVMNALARAEDRHFWHVSRNRFVSDRLGHLGVTPPAGILELGCGGGCVAAHLARLGYAVTGVEGHLSRVLQAAARAPGASFVVHDLSRGVDEIGLGQFDAVALFDVIEHLDEPRTVLAQALSRVAPGGLIVGTVPALMSLWSEVDVRSGHRLRYDVPTLLERLREIPECDVLEVMWFNRSMVPLLWLQRRALPVGDPLVRGLVVPWAPINTALYAVLRLEHYAATTLIPRAVPGASLWFAARRRRRRPPRSVETTSNDESGTVRA